MTRLIAVIIVTATVAGCADTTTLATRNTTAPVADDATTTMDSIPFPGLMPL
ncbi:hypothetical protein [Ovoidimarina sediminis]|uniref:hypothetical protein n=1 Tax=Ovoidimarina sediminis TaxID=3079856 RepID=UPI0029134B7C|nr:hypothetical protein [Rhodophyticola sp. MJ-SS7]MDU8942644.1 hypothetical protein [Rhodophyticola sp. MJ-SS7]